MKVAAFIWRQRYKVTFFRVKEKASYKTLPPSVELFISNDALIYSYHQ